ncbi:MAG TPA: PhoH family protein [Myxococcota bacterium]|nr:PhoH family protein [Myxococcota bacterium]HNZ03627.1 PhoH family protein [Myxococcota bacterium]HOD07017.1 PhoH family protein [Myxococcota bacterium]HPB49623.1 PhoH family protein [Myxococcota bacterium]HQP94909.1 PhoH family protein [Myxococcota bacterium]
MKKNFVLDTNVLLHDPNALTGFADNNVCVPIYVIEEIDNFKKELSELGRNARQISRDLDALRALGNIGTGVQTEAGGSVRVLFSTRSDVSEAEIVHRDVNLSHIMDRLIMGTAIELKAAEPDIPVVFVTKDTNLRIRAEAAGLVAVDYDKQGKDVTELYTGTGEMLLGPDLIGELFRVGHVDVPGGLPGLFHNQYLLVRNEANPSQSALARAATREGRLYRTVEVRDSVWGIKPRNKEQHFAFDALLRDDISLVTLIGKAGTGKTLLAIAAGLQKVTEEETYTRMLVSRPIFPLGRDIGYLPGDVEEKLNPWMQPIHDNLEFLMGLSRQDRKTSNRSPRELMDMNMIKVEPLTYIRGRSIPNQYMIVDEAQNLTPHEVKTILTRVGEGTKIVLTGDPYQIDNPYVDSVNNGLAYIAEKFKDSDIAATVTLMKGERSRLAELAANLL